MLGFESTIRDQFFGEECASGQVRAQPRSNSIEGIMQGLNVEFAIHNLQQHLITIDQA